MDWSSVQEAGAARREENAKRTKKKGRQVVQESQLAGSLSYKKLVITAQSLVTATDEWMHDAADDNSGTSKDCLPVFMVGLHACGSLTLDILRAMVRQLRNAHTQETRWMPAGGLVVGCCYNLLRPEGELCLAPCRCQFSSSIDCVSQTGRSLRFTESHLQLAAQMPLQWGRTSATLAEATLAARKVSWRALLSAMLFEATEERPLLSGRTRQLKRLGRLNDSAYRSWEAFLGIAQERLELEVAEARLDRALESRLEVFHFLRCALGPVVESFLLLDRKLWLQQQLNVSVPRVWLHVVNADEPPSQPLETKWQVCLVNLFDQGSGSARNVAVAVVPVSAE